MTVPRRAAGPWEEKRVRVATTCRAAREEPVEAAPLESGVAVARGLEPFVPSRAGEGMFGDLPAGGSGGGGGGGGGGSGGGGAGPRGGGGSAGGGGGPGGGGEGDPGRPGRAVGGEGAP